MTKILFVCHGNICRSPMAESVMTHLVKESGVTDMIIQSAATSTEELGNPVHPGTQKILRQHSIPLVPHRARQMTQLDSEKYDYLIGMDSANLRNMIRITGSEEKIYRLLDWSPSPRDIADPWYTGDFERTFQDVWEGCTALLHTLIRQN